IGTGFVVSKDGYILTNAHVVNDNGQTAQNVTVVFKGAGTQTTKVTGTIAGVDLSTDVAVIKVDPSQAPTLQPVPLGDSSKVQVGEPVVAIGNPLGLDFSVSSGIVSAVDREMQSPNGSTIKNGIQTDASINPGNSGGPLFDSKGDVIGINEQIASQSGGNEGIGFAVPIDTAVAELQQLESGSVQSQQQAAPQSSGSTLGF
ncbi:MAG TPA: trypsin-like peptidase domain-containing protein, partial [Thermoleophilia bacterium]|nr:trypsin-like peptidase domain-containing protein [Thermoleophilia bacterium]